MRNNNRRADWGARLLLVAVLGILLATRPSKEGFSTTPTEEDRNTLIPVFGTYQRFFFPTNLETPTPTPTKDIDAQRTPGVERQ